MPKVEFDRLPAAGRVWVFAASDPLSETAEQVLLAAVDRFVQDWHAHGAPLDASSELREGRFLCIAVDERSAGASGCSVDGLFRTLRALEPEIATSLVAGGLVFWRDAEGLVRRATREQFRAHAAAGHVTAATPVFDASVNTLADWRERFERPAGASWHARYLDAPPSTNQ